MAKRNGFFGGGHGKDEDREFDQRPGNASDSREYAKRFDVRSETEFTNRPETPEQIRARAQQQMDQAQADAERDAQSAVHFFPSVGKFIIPPENSWAAHAELVKDKRQNLWFNPEKYVYFDKIVAETLGRNSPIVNKNHPDYARYEGLRNNLAVLRNDTIGIYLDDGSFDPGDEKYVPYFASIAKALGEALADDTWYKRPFMPSMSQDIANVEGVGAREMYKFLLKSQTKPGPWRHLLAMIGVPDRSWQLPPLESTPFSDAALSAPPPRDPECPPAQAVGQNIGLTSLAQQMVAVADGLRDPQTLPPPTREASVEEARIILRWLKNLQFGDRDMEEWLAAGTPPEQLAKVEALARLVEIYGGEIRKTALQFPVYAYSDEATGAAEAAGGMALAVAQHAGLSLQNIPPSWELREAQSPSRLLDALALGIERASSQAMDEKTLAEHMLAIGGRVEASAREMRSVDTLQEPAREESVELAREILRRLKNMTFSDKTLEEFITTARPDDQLAFARKIEELVDSFKTLLAEAAELNPNIMLDSGVKDATDAAGTFAYALKLMAAKEMPGSVAAAQQISADVTQMPEEWKHLHDHTVGRLVQSMEGGLEKAVSEISAAQEQQEQDEEQAQEITDAALLHSDMSKRKRRKRRSSSSGKGGGKQRKQHLEMTADDYALKQGRFRDQDIPEARPVARPASPMGLRPEDLAAVRELGGSLRDIGNQAREMTPVATNEKIAPDDKSLAQRQAERNQPGNSKHQPRI